MLKQVDALPSPERQFAMVNGNRKLRGRERRTNVRRHVIRPFRGVAILPDILRNQARKEIVKVGDHVRIGVFLNH